MNSALVEYISARVVFVFLVPLVFWLGVLTFHPISFAAVKSALEHGVVVPLINFVLATAFIIIGGVSLFIPEKRKKIELSFMLVLFLYANMFIVLSL